MTDIPSHALADTLKAAAFTDEPRTPKARGQQRTAEEREEHLVRTAEFLARGWTLARISRHLSSSVKTVKSDMESLRLIRTKRVDAAVDTARADQLAEVALVKAQAFESWFRSLESEDTRTMRSKPGAEGPDGKRKVELGETTVVMRKRCGDPRFLELVMRCEEREARLLGLDYDAPAQLRRVAERMAEESGVPVELIIENAKQLRDATKPN